MFRVSIRYEIPLLIVVFTAVLAVYTVQKEWGAAEAFVRGEAVSDMLDRMTLLQKQFSYTFGNGEHERIAQEMSLISSGPEPQIAMLADDAVVVLGATNREWVGRSLTEVARAQWPGWSGEPLEAIIDRVRAQFAGELYLAAAGRYVLAIYPVMLRVRASSLPAERVGVLLVQRDLSRQLAHARRTVGKHWVEMTGVLAGLAVILGILIHLLVTRRLNTLLNMTQRFAAGNLEARADLRGTDEVAILGRAFDRMAEQVADTQRQLERRVQQRTAQLGQTISELSYSGSHSITM
jgi:methyl-accepting chemotaxis protein